MIAEGKGPVSFLSCNAIEGNMDLDRIHYEGRKQWRRKKEGEKERNKQRVNGERTDCCVD